MGNYERKEIYRIRANIVEEDYNNRKDSLGVSYHFQVKIDKAKSCSAVDGFGYGTDREESQPGRRDSRRKPECRASAGKLAEK